MEGIKLDIRKFGWLNDNDAYGIFTKEINEFYESMTDEQKMLTGLDSFAEYMNEQLFLTYTYVLVTPENSLFGFDGLSYHLIASDLQDIYEGAKLVR